MQDKKSWCRFQDRSRKATNSVRDHETDITRSSFEPTNKPFGTPMGLLQALDRSQCAAHYAHSSDTTTASTAFLR
jgi:hypothetical protein